MDDIIPKFTEEQWEFLAVFEAFDCPVTIEMAGLIVPLLPGSLIQLITDAESLKWIEKVGDDRLILTNDIPIKWRKKLTQINTRQRLTDMLSKFSIDRWSANVHTKSLVGVLEKSGRHVQSGELEINLAYELLEHNDFEAGRRHLFQAIARLSKSADKNTLGGLYVASVIHLSNISFAMGKGFSEIEDFLHQAQEVADRLGDIRSHALINLHVGRLFYFTDRREEALVALALGNEEIEEIDDHDIRSQSAQFLGIYFFIQGEFREAFDYLEIALRAFESKTDQIIDSPMVPIFFGYCAAYLGRYHRAIGSLDFGFRLSLERSEKGLASTIRSVLGMILVILGKTRQGSYHLERALAVAKASQNAIGIYFSRGGIAVRYFIEGNIGKSYEALRQTLVEGTRAGLVRQFASPWVLEMLYEYFRLGFEAIPDFEYPDIVERILAGVNVHLQGVAHRLRAKDGFNRGDDHAFIEKELALSETCLRKAADPVQLSKTLLESARLALIRGNRKEASRLAQEARYCLGGYYEEFFPVEFQHLLEDHQTGTKQNQSPKALMEKYLEMIESLYPSESQEEIFSKVMIETCRMFGAERSGFFWFPGSPKAAKPELRAHLNLSLKEVVSENFKPSLDLIQKVFRKNTPIVDKVTMHETALGKRIMRSALCIPVEVKGQTQGVLYYDNSYLDNAFQLVDLSIAKRMTRHTNIVVERRLQHLAVAHRAETLTSENVAYKGQRKTKIITTSPKMEQLLEQVEKIAETDSTVLLLGETGTGKELLANHIYQHSQRADGPFIVVDSTTIPDTLLESELFGHEKGAFTGADRRKIGCIETAHKGTLFIDEVGELTSQAQTKLLRAIQEKTIRRVGGLEPIKSDFRLITATNRDLEHEVAEGRFREDLFYRLNVISLKLPPLRERDEDALALVQHFMERYSKKYNRPSLQLGSEQKEAIRNYPWPGNARELQNIVERAVILSRNDIINLDLPVKAQARDSDPFSDQPSLNEIQRRYIKYVLEQTDGKISGPGGALDILGMKRTSLYSRMKALGIKRTG